jgi:hypothetical protein
MVLKNEGVIKAAPSSVYIRQKNFAQYSFYHNFPLVMINTVNYLTMAPRLIAL